MKAILVRHTQIAPDVAGLCYGRFDVACAETFAEETAALRLLLPWQPSAVWSSPASRCTNLATQLAGAAPVQIDGKHPSVRRLNEGDFPNEVE
jgi:alpha-ribazole phosphatase